MDSSTRRSRRSTTSLTLARVFNTDSPITKRETDIQSFLSICLLNWDQYDEEEKQVIISTLPCSRRAIEHYTDGKINCPISPEFVGTDIVIRDQIARFKRDVNDGFYTKTWQEKARKAMEDRADGKFDKYLAKHADELFADAEDAEDAEEAPSSDEEYKSKSKGNKSKARERAKRKSKLSRALATVEDVERVENGGSSPDELAG